MLRASILEPPQPVPPMNEAMMWFQRSTLSSTTMASIGGYLMGGVFSLVSSLLAAETTTQCMGTKDFFKHTLRSCHNLGYNFAFFGFLFSGIEVAAEKRRGRKDVWNPTISGAFIGGYYGWRSYRYPGLSAGIVAGAALSVMFEKLMDMVGFAQH